MCGGPDRPHQGPPLDAETRPRGDSWLDSSLPYHLQEPSWAPCSPNLALRLVAAVSWRPSWGDVADEAQAPAQQVEPFAWALEPSLQLGSLSIHVNQLKKSYR